MRYQLMVPLVLVGSVAPLPAQVSIGIRIPGLSIGINQPVYPRLIQVPGQPVYYAPGSDLNYFFYDGMYWVYQDDEWYASTWYNGPWDRMDRYRVPEFILRIPVRYYRRPPAYFRGWQREAPPRWGEHWGRDWEERRHGWNEWDHRSTPPPAQLPVYQQRYPRDRYPREDEQREIHGQNYRYQPREPVVQEHYQRGREDRRPDRGPEHDRGHDRDHERENDRH